MSLTTPGDATPPAPRQDRYSWRLPRRTGPYLTGTAGTNRLTGLDSARGLALIGMMAAHVGVTTCGLTSVPGLLNQAHGRASILFAVIAGFSLGIMSGRTRPHTGETLVRTRLRLLVRSAMLLVLAACTVTVGTNVAIILGYYAAWLALAIPFLRVRSSHLFALSAATALVGPVLIQVVPWAMGQVGMVSDPYSLDANGALVTFFVTGTYPGLVWMAFILLGLGLSRLDWSRSVNLWRLLGVGVLCAVLGYGGGWVASRAVEPETVDSYHLVSPTDPVQCEPVFPETSAPGSYDGQDEWEQLAQQQLALLQAQALTQDQMVDELMTGLSISRDELVTMMQEQADALGQDLRSTLQESLAQNRATDAYDLAHPAGEEDTIGSGTGYEDTTDPQPVTLDLLATAQPHSSSPFEALGSAGVSMLVIAVMQLIARRTRYLLAPLAAVGSTSLSVYCAHIVVIRAAGHWGYAQSNLFWALMAAGFCLASMAWLAVWSRGPLEHLVHVVSVRSTRATD